jgi:hypothetical protein
MRDRPSSAKACHLLGLDTNLVVQSRRIPPLGHGCVLSKGQSIHTTQLLLSTNSLGFLVYIWRGK